MDLRWASLVVKDCFSCLLVMEVASGEYGDMVPKLVAAVRDRFHDQTPQLQKTTDYEQDKPSGCELGDGEWRRMGRRRGDGGCEEGDTVCANSMSSPVIKRNASSYQLLGSKLVVLTCAMSHHHLCHSHYYYHQQHCRSRSCHYRRQRHCHRHRHRHHHCDCRYNSFSKAYRHVTWLWGALVKATR